MENDSDLNDYLNVFINKVQLKIINDYEKAGFVNRCPTIGFSVGKKYIKIFRQTQVSKNIYCFISIDGGFIYSAKSWKQPNLKIDFGSIFNCNYTKYVGVYGL